MVDSYVNKSSVLHECQWRPTGRLWVKKMLHHLFIPWIRALMARESSCFSVVFVFLFMNCDLCPMNETCWFVFFVLSLDNFVSFFLVFFFCLYWSDCVYDLVKHQYLKVWNCWTSGCVDVRQLFFFSFCSALNFCHQCLSCFVFCFRLYSFWFLFVLAFFVPWLFCKSVILPMIKFRLWVVPAHTEICKSNVVFSLCSSSYTYLNMSSMCVHFGGFFLFVLFLFFHIPVPLLIAVNLKWVVSFSGSSSLLLFFLHWLHPDALFFAV